MSRHPEQTPSSSTDVKIKFIDRLINLGITVSGLGIAAAGIYLMIAGQNQPTDFQNFLGTMGAISETTATALGYFGLRRVHRTQPSSI